MQRIILTNNHDEGKSDKCKAYRFDSFVGTFKYISSFSSFIMKVLMMFITKVLMTFIMKVLMIRANADYCLAGGRMEVRSIKEIQAGEEVIVI